jgi:hypothetical protein
MNLFGKSLSAESGSVAVASGQLSDPRCSRRDDFLHPRLAQAGGLDRLPPTWDAVEAGRIPARQEFYRLWKNFKISRRQNET